MEELQQIIDSIQDWMWTYINIGLLIGCALYFTVRTRFVQFRLFKDMVRLMFSSDKSAESVEVTETASKSATEAENKSANEAASKPATEAENKSATDPTKGRKHISSFQAFIVALASRIGTGNLAGVATAISVGGPGAIFWMWVMALFGAATAFVESTLAQLFKRNSRDAFHGGPAYYMRHGLHKGWMGVIFSLLMILTFGFANNAMQSNTIALAWDQAFGVPLAWMGVILMVLTLCVIFGGIHRIANVSSAVVPVMAVVYLLLAIFIVVTHISVLPKVLTMIVENAFGVGQIAGGTLGTIVMMGIKRGLFSNEAGEGSAPNAAATATVSHPVKQGLIQALGVFTDTLVVCSCTAFLILCSGVDYTASNGIQLTQNALTEEIGSLGNPFIAVMIWLFAFSTIIANCYYGETNLLYFCKKKSALFAYRIVAGLFVLGGALISLDLAWSMIDLCMALITICNLIAIILLFPKVRILVDDYVRQRREGKDPTFRKSLMPDIADELEAWS